MRAKIWTRTLGLLLLGGGVLGTATAQDSIYSASGDVAVVSSYVWRGQRLTDDPSLQPSMTLGIEGFAFNAWGSMDLTSFNDFNTGDPRIGKGDGLKGHFTEIDYTFSYDYSFENVSVGGGAIIYTFPERFSTTTELYGALSFDSVPLAPNVTLYLDVDETTSAVGGDAGVYLLLGAGHSFPINSDIVSSFDVSASLGFANGGFTKFYYSGLDKAGLHDGSLTASLPFNINDNWSAGAWVTVSGLIGDEIRAQQYTGADDGTTVWGGFSLSLGF